MAEFPGFTLWTDAYLGDTGHLSTLEHGAYLLLLITMWRSGGSLPNDDRKLAKCARLTPSQWGRIRDTMMDFFTVEDGRVTQGRLTDELTFVKQRSARQSENARAKSRKTKKSPPATAKPNASQTHAPTLTPTLTEDTSLRSVAPAAQNPSPRDELSRVLDAARAQAVLDHRQRIRKPLTAYAAKQLADKFAKCADPNGAADAMISNGWQGFEPEWLNRRSNAGGKQPQETTIERRMRELRERVADEQRSEREGEPDPDALDGLPLLTGPHH
jgi:uncharacterized protein YdaU (DUF1376 family)